MTPETLSSKTDNNYLMEYIDISSIEETGKISRTNILTFGDSPSRARKIVRKNDVLLSNVRPYLKSFAAVKDDKENLICSTGYSVLREISNRSRFEFLYQYILSSLFMKQVNNMMVGSNYPALNNSQVEKIKSPLPPLPEQKKISTILSRVDEKIEHLQNEKTSYTQLKNYLLQKLLTGQIRVQV
jgi:type I restriction enzyme, S subunit